jgi:predicted nucleic acid-binding protein
MMVLVDTSVWSIGFRRRREALSPAESAVRATLEKIVTEGRAALLGAIRQELLSGIREERQFLRLRSSLRAFPDVPLETEDYEEAARLGNFCRSRGIAGSPIDFLICAVSVTRDWPVFTQDRDFTLYSRHIPVQLLVTH